MSQLIRTPGGYWTAFFTGFGGTLVTIGLPLAGILIESHATLKVAEMTFVVVLGVALIVGLAFVVPRLLYAWAYRRVTGASLSLKP